MHLPVEVPRRCGRRVARSRAAPRRAAPAAAADLDDVAGVVCFTLIVDDLVIARADGTAETALGRVGGGGPQSAWGAALHASAPAVALAAGVGEHGAPHEVVRWLERAGVATDGLHRTPGARTPRAWQILEPDGRRTQVWRTEAGPELYAMLRPGLAELPPRLRGARAYHLGVHPQHFDLAHLVELRRGGDATLSVEPFTAADGPVDEKRLAQLLGAGDVFSPNAAEAASLVGEAPPLETLARLARAGATGVLTLRCGGDGAAALDVRTGEAWEVPAVLPPERVADVTGCGNAFCGGFLASMLAGEPLLDALLFGSSAAAYMAEAVGVPDEPPAALRDAAMERAAALRPRAVRLA